jgi:hypothetical protein
MFSIGDLIVEKRYHMFKLTDEKSRFSNDIYIVKKVKFFETTNFKICYICISTVNGVQIDGYWNSSCFELYVDPMMFNLSEENY